jgi:hypothetical protein
MKKITLLITIMIISLGYAQPTSSAAAPTKLPVDVKSIFSDVYTNISTVQFFPDWGQGTKYVNYVILSSSPAENVLKYSNLDYQGINITVEGNKPGLDFSAMTTFHFDLWTPDVTKFKMYLIDGTSETAVTLTPTLSGWNSYDLVLATSFPSINKSAIRQLKFEQDPQQYKASTRSVYLDNIYFWRTPLPAGTPTISFAIPAKTFGDAPFSLSSLVSSDNNTGSFTFTSSNPSVASISGSTLTILSAGTATITAAQAASGTFIGGSKTADLVVYNPDPVPTQAAPVPPNRNAVDVKSFFSNKYTNIPIDTWTPSWSSSEATDVQIAGDDTKKILFSDVLGIDFSSAGKHQDLTAMTHFHMDYWTSNTNPNNSCVFNVKLADFGGTAKEYTSMLLAMNSATNPKLESGKWVSVDVPLTAFTAGTSSQIRTDIAQLLLFSNLNAVYAPNEAFPGGVVVYGALITDKAKVYVDNIYLYKVGALATEKFETSTIKMYPNPVKNSLTIEANSAIDKIVVYSILGQEVISKSPKSSATTLQTSTLQRGTYIVKSTIGGKTTTSKFIKE